VTVEVLRKPVPLIISVKVLEPRGADEGDKPVMEGIGFKAIETVKVMGLELPPPGGGLLTTTANVPAFARSEAVKVMLS
jgi:hypothetical protein